MAPRNGSSPGTRNNNGRKHTKESRNWSKKTIQAQPTWPGVFIREMLDLAVNPRSGRMDLCVLSQPQGWEVNQTGRDRRLKRVLMGALPDHSRSPAIPGACAVDSGARARLPAHKPSYAAEGKQKALVHGFLRCAVAFPHWWSVLYELPHADHRLPLAPHADLKEKGSRECFPPRLDVVPEAAWPGQLAPHPPTWSWRPACLRLLSAHAVPRLQQFK